MRKRATAQTMKRLRDEEAARCVLPSPHRALRDLRFYAERLCVEKPERYEVYQTAADGLTVKLSDAIIVVLAAFGCECANVPRAASPGSTAP